MFPNVTGQLNSTPANNGGCLNEAYGVFQLSTKVAGSPALDQGNQRARSAYFSLAYDNATYAAGGSVTPLSLALNYIIKC